MAEVFLVVGVLAGLVAVAIASAMQPVQPHEFGKGRDLALGVSIYVAVGALVLALIVWLI